MKKCTINETRQKKKTFISKKVFQIIKQGESQM